MKNYILIIALICLACSTEEGNPKKTSSSDTRISSFFKKPIEKEFANNGQLVVPEIQAIIDSSNVEGAILLYDPQRAMYYSNDFELAKKGSLPASTFKIPNSIIALETGVINSDTSVFKWNGEKRNMKIWEQDLTFREAFQFSCVPCYQDVARRIGVERMNSYIRKLEYGHMEIDTNSIDNFWLEGNSKISQIQQIQFLTRFYNSDLPISPRTKRVMKKLIQIEKHDGIIISGKTGWSVTNKENNGWFVGFVESQYKVFFFATNIKPKENYNLKSYLKSRKEITFEALKEMGFPQ